MLKHCRKFRGIFSIIYVECKQESYEIYNEAKINIDVLGSSPEIRDSELRIGKDRGFIMAENLKDDHLKVEKNKDSKEPENVANIDANIEMEGIDNMAISVPELNDFEKIFKEQVKSAAFGYELDNNSIGIHDICVQDVRDICRQSRTIRQTVPCRPDGNGGCRGGFLPDGPPVVESARVLCAEERLSPDTGCDRIINEVGFEVVLRYNENNRVVITPRDVFECFWFEFARFPSGVFFPNTPEGLEEFREELARIDGSCKVIIIDDVRVEVQGNNCVLVIEYRAVDKLWKHENLIVLALKPFGDNITVKQEFGQGHNIGPCVNDLSNLG